MHYAQFCIAPQATISRVACRRQPDQFNCEPPKYYSNRTGEARPAIVFAGSDDGAMSGPVANSQSHHRAMPKADGVGPVSIGLDSRKVGPEPEPSASSGSCGSNEPPLERMEDAEDGLYQAIEPWTETVGFRFTRRAHCQFQGPSWLIPDFCDIIALVAGRRPCSARKCRVMVLHDPSEV
jgi:hypothetical protein